ncbi:hypothetical protein, partial [Sorangium cellulosum]|uniref:hypothetical protein n=1 Tax=Sorangium cellulosum TaxID=56 RepID=UPI001F313DAC
MSRSPESGAKRPATSLFFAGSWGHPGRLVGPAQDAFGHRRTSTTELDDEGIFPQSYVNAAGHTTIVAYDDALGVLLRRVDPNQLVTEWQVDGFGRLGIERRPDGTT